MLKGPEFAVNYVIADGEINLLYFSSEHHQPGQLSNLYSLNFQNAGADWYEDSPLGAQIRENYNHI